MKQLQPQTLEIVVPSNHPRIERVHQYHIQCLKAFGDHVGFAYLAGCELLTLKAETPHGEFEDLKETQFSSIPRASLGRYMQFAEALQTRLVATSHHRPFLLTNGEMSQESQDGLLRAVHDFADGKTLTALYRDLGVIRPPKKQRYHARTGANQDTEASRQEHAIALAKSLLTDIALVSQPETLSRLPDDLIEQLEEARIELGGALKHVRKPIVHHRRG